MSGWEDLFEKPIPKSKSKKVEKKEKEEELTFDDLEEEPPKEDEEPPKPKKFLCGWCLEMRAESHPLRCKENPKNKPTVEITEKIFDFLKDKNTLRIWIQSRTKTEYPEQWGVISRFKNHNRYALQWQSMELFVLFCKEHGYKI